MVADILNPLVTLSESERGNLIGALKTVMGNQAEIKRIENLVRNEKYKSISNKLYLLLSVTSWHKGFQMTFAFFYNFCS